MALSSAERNVPFETQAFDVQEKPLVRRGAEESPVKVFIQNNLAFSIFVLLFVPLIIYMLLAFFTQWSVGLNTFLFGKFKRPLPLNPALYYDVNCIDIMSASDFANENQVQRCRELRPIDRPGPPLGL